MRRTVGFPALIFATLFIARLAHAQEIRAIALDKETKQPIAGALVSLLSRSHVALDTTRTATDGSFTLKANEGGKFFIRLRREGLPTEESDAIFLKVGETRVDTMYVASARSVLRVEDLVSREVFRLFGVTTSALPDKSVILPDELQKERGSAQWAAEVVTRLGPPYVRVSGSGARVCYQIYTASCARVYVNGQPALSSTDIPAEDLEAIVVITPMDVRSTVGRTNGAIVFFTTRILRGR